MQPLSTMQQLRSFVNLRHAIIKKRNALKAETGYSPVEIALTRKKFIIS